MRNPDSGTSLVALAKVTKPVGLRGAVRVELLCDGPDRLRNVRQVYRGPSPDTVAPVTLLEVAERGKNVVLFFQDCSSRDEAEQLRGEYLFIEESESVPSHNAAPRIHELTGCEVFDPTGNRRGIVEHVYDLPGSRMLGIRSDEGGREVLVPLVDAWVARVDRGKKRIELTSDELFVEL